jgi:hypothetical protein
MIAVLVVITEGDTLFKNVIIQSALGYKDVRLHFVYGSQGKCVVVNKYTEYTDIYTAHPETFENIIYKGVDGLQVIIDSCKPDLIIRTNMSTLFDFKKVIEYSKKLPKSGFYGGPFIGEITNKTPMISGTCIMMTLDVAKYIVSNRESIDTLANEDVALSYLMDRMTHLTINVKRIDFIDNRVLFHKCTIGDDSVFCFRFKTSDRNGDSNLMKSVLETFTDGGESLQTIYDNFRLDSELPLYSELFSRSIFMVNATL